MDGIQSSSSPGSASGAGFVLVGFWGVPNFGDEWLMRSAVTFLEARYPRCRITALVRSVELERRLGDPPGRARLRSGFFPDPAFFRTLPTLLAELWSADLVLIGGGGLITDRYTALSVPRYAVPALIGLALGVPVVWWGLGVVPPRALLLRRLAFATLRRSTRVLVRDPSSQRTLRTAGVPARLSQDLSALSPPAPVGLAAHKVVAVNFRDAAPTLAEGRRSFLLSCAARFEEVLLLAAEAGDEAIYAAMRQEIAETHPQAAARLAIVPATDLAGIQSALSRAAMVVSERLHVSLYALGAGVPTVVLSYEDKVDSVIARLHPGTGIVQRDRFWGDAQVRDAAQPTVAACRAVEPAVLATGLAAELDRAAAVRPGWADRGVAILWLAALLPAGALAAMLIGLRRGLREVLLRAGKAATADEAPPRYADQPATRTMCATDGTPSASMANSR
jgi:polysaccharide pyruvyl transferase WcaK-like protein